MVVSQSHRVNRNSKPEGFVPIVLAPKAVCEAGTARTKEAG